MCGQDSATKACSTCRDGLRCEQCDIKWHGHPDRLSHKRQDIYSIIHQASTSIPNVPEKTQSVSPPKMCSVCGGNQASQHCQQCDADFCDACGKKMHLHPKRKNHTLQPLPGGGLRRSPEGSSVRISPVEKQEREDPAGQSYHQQQVIKRPDTFNNQQLPLISNQQVPMISNQQVPLIQNQQPQEVLASPSDGQGQE